MAKSKSEKVRAERPQPSIRRTKAEQSRAPKPKSRPAAASAAAKAASNPELEAAIEKDPDAADPYLVYADWLQTQGDPRGELIALAHANSQFDKSTPKGVRQERQRAYDTLRAARAAEFLGMLADHPKQVSLEWHLGFVRAARVENRDVKQSALLPVLVRELLTLPVARFLRSLTIGQDSGTGGAGGRKNFAPMVRALAESTFPATFERLSLVDPGENPRSRTPIADLGDLTPVFARLPGLKSLHLRCARMTLQDIDLPSLTDFELQIGDPAFDLFESLASARWPLTRFVIGFGTPGDRLPDERRGIVEQGMVALLTPASTGFERLEELGVRNFVLDFDLLGDAETLFRRVRTLELSGAGLHDTDAERMVQQRETAYPRVERLIVGDNFLTSVGLAALKGAFKYVDSGRQKDPQEEGGAYFDEIEE